MRCYWHPIALSDALSSGGATELVNIGELQRHGRPFRGARCICGRDAGPDSRRSREYLGSIDACIVAARGALLASIAAVQAGRDPLHVIRVAAHNDMPQIVVVSEVIPRDADYRSF
jgi:hypothetical protein